MHFLVKNIVDPKPALQYLYSASVVLINEPKLPLVRPKQVTNKFGGIND